MASNSTYRFELAVSYRGRKIGVWSDHDNDYRTIQNYYFQPLFDLECDLIATAGDQLQLPIQMWTEELETIIEVKLKAIYTEQVINVQMMPFDEVKLEWREAPPGVEIPNHHIGFNHCPAIHVFIVKCSDDETARNLKTHLQQAPHSLVSGLHVIASNQAHNLYKVNSVGVPISETRTVRPDIDERHRSFIEHVRQFHDNLENQFCQLKRTIETVEERLNRFCTEQQLEERLNRCCTEQQLEERLNRFCTEQQLEERLNQCCTEQQLKALETKLTNINDDFIRRNYKVERSTDDVKERIGNVEGSVDDVIERMDRAERSTEDVIGRIDKLEGFIDDVTRLRVGIIDSLTFNKRVDTDFRPELVTSIPGEHEGEQSRVICAECISTDYIYSVNDDNIQRYIEIDGAILGLATDGNGFLFVVVEKNSEFILRKYKNQKKLFEENITDLLPGGCFLPETLIIRDHNIYIQSGGIVHVLRLLENPENRLIDGCRVKKYQLPDGDFFNIYGFDVDTRGRMFIYCAHTRRLLYLTPEAEQISFIYMNDCGLTFDPYAGFPCVINDDHVLLSVYSNTGNRGAVISIRYNDVGFIDHPRIILNSTDSRTCDIHHMFNSNAVVIRHRDNSDDQNSLRFYNINTVLTPPI
ncbi:uncharacterized protein LOC141909953 [Tubulanus polymorphus]|uniref:uncharacterized protein LOC141909953 n=1 Tax=Tubulanus polymorphus TaxID=672921 RepID=UPI003DA54C4F